MPSTDDTDPVDVMLQKTGCISIHYKVQECIAETQDWQYPLKMVLIVRTDLKLGKGKIASQCSHAAILCYQKNLQQNPELLKTWNLYGQPKIVLKVENLVQMEELYKQAKQLGIIAEIVQDAGKTQVAPSTITTLGLGPHGAALDTLVKELKLL